MLLENLDTPFLESPGVWAERGYGVGSGAFLSGTCTALGLGLPHLLHQLPDLRGMISKKAREALSTTNPLPWVSAEGPQSAPRRPGGALWRCDTSVPHSGLLANRAHIPSGLWLPHLDFSCGFLKEIAGERRGTLLKTQGSGETVSTLRLS